MPRVRCVTMQKDEGLLLDAWIRYHGYLFGFEHLEILDNGSRDSLTLAILERFEAVGVTVHRQHTSIESYEAKGGIVADIIRGWDQSHAYDFALPCDTDEFFVLFTADGLCCQRHRIDAALAALTNSETALWMETLLFNVPQQPGWFHLERFPKGFLPSGSILDLDSGFHYPQTRRAEGIRRTDFTYLHFHNKPYDLVQAHTRRKLYRRVDVSDPEALRTFTGAGAHMTKNLLMSRGEYTQQYDRSVTIRFPAFGLLMQALGAQERMIVGDAAPGTAALGTAAMGTAAMADVAPAPAEQVTLRLPPSQQAAAEMVTFDGPGYLADHPDVAAASGCGLPHYLYYGFEEGRRLRRAPHSVMLATAR